MPRILLTAAVNNSVTVRTQIASRYFLMVLGIGLARERPEMCNKLRRLNGRRRNNCVEAELESVCEEEGETKSLAPSRALLGLRHPRLP